MSDILDRLRGNGEPWTFAEVVAEIERLRVALQTIEALAECSASVICARAALEAAPLFARAGK